MWLLRIGTQLGTQRGAYSREVLSPKGGTYLRGANSDKYGIQVGFLLSFGITIDCQHGDVCYLFIYLFIYWSNGVALIDAILT